jgi:hypothetical protein
MQHDIPRVIKENMEAIVFYCTWQKLGDPFGKGWLDWPFWALDIIRVLGGANGNN